MAASFLVKALSGLLGSAARWVQFSDGAQAPVHGAILMDPDTATPMGSAANPARVTGRDLVAVPFRKDMFRAGVSGSGYAPSINGGFPENGDGTQSGMFVSVPASATWANVATLDFWVQGRVVGLRVLRSADYGGKPIGCMIDGVAYAVKTDILVTPAGQSPTNTNPGVSWQILADDLDEGLHYVELVFPCDISVSRLWAVLGYIAEARAGYRPIDPYVNFSLRAPLALTASWTEIIASNDKATGIRKIVFYNPTGGPITAQVRYTNDNGVIWSKSVAAGDTLEFDPGGSFAHAAQITGNGLMAQIMDLN